MKIIFLGVGEAFDENYPNNSSLVLTEKTKLLLDCGFTIPWQMWKFNPDPNFLDAVYISHIHGDHFLGLPALLLRMWEGGRKRDFTIICQKNIKDYFAGFMESIYGGFMERFEYKIKFIEAKDGGNIAFSDLNLSFQKTIHSGENLAIKIDDGKSTMVYGGDGAPMEKGDFYKNLDLMILETYLYDQEKIGHATIVSAIKFAEENKVKCLALTHMNRDFRKNELPKIKNKITSDKVKIIIPEPLDEYNL